MFGKSKQKKAQVEVETGDKESEVHLHPMICLFDFNDDVLQELELLRFNCVTGSFGSNVRVNNEQYSQKLMKLNHNYPSNLHEFDIVMLDMTESKIDVFDPSQHSLDNNKGSKAHALLSCYPEQVFDPRPFSVHIVSGEIEELLKKKSIIIAFCGEENKVDYQFVEITSHSNQVTGKGSYSNLDFYKKVASRSKRHGRKSVTPNGNKLSPLFEKHLSRIEYSNTFSHPTIWKDGKNENSKDFIPLLFNEREEIISYAHFIGGSLVLVFPNIDEKSQFICDLFNTYLPEIMPDLFPYHGEFGWLDNGEYLLPNEGELLQKKSNLELEYKNNIENIDKEIEATRNKYAYLHDLIYETGDELVKSIQKYMIWLGFNSVIDMDEKVTDVFEEDLQIETKKGLLVVEIKGIGGTSTDKACSQISKIKYRRSEQREKFDVFGLYIVNHQRYLAPKNRTNPPFTENQLNDAKLEKRGLLTTYSLYEAYFLIEDGILTKEEVRDNLFNVGLITFPPKNIMSIGTSNEVFKNGKIAILDLNGECTIKIGSTLIGKKDGKLSKMTIESIQLNTSDVDEASTGEVGLALSYPIKKGTELFLQEV